MIQTLHVFLNNASSKHNVGRLAIKDKKIYFEYDKDFLTSAIELSPYKLPLKSGVFTCEDKVFDGLFGVFADSLPDGWGKLLLDRHLMSQGLSLQNISPLDRLAYIGKYGVGALSYEPVSQNLFELDIEDVELDALAFNSKQILKGTSDEMLDLLLGLGGSSAGARPKAMIQINKENHIVHGAQTLEDGYEHYMVKFASGVDSSDVGKMEYIYSLMAKEAGLDMPDTKLLQTKTNSYFAIKRFDRNVDEKVHMHSVAGLTHSDYRFPSLDYDDLLSLTLHISKDAKEQAKMFRLAAFNLLSHNRDDHAKNFSFILREGEWHLSPAYDLTFSFGPGGEHSTTYLGEGKNPNMKHLQELAKKHALKDATEIIDNVVGAVSKFEQIAKNVGLNKQTIVQYKKQMALTP